MAATKKQQQPAAKPGNSPAQVFRARGVKVSVFENVGQAGGRESKFYKTTVQRVYKEGEEFKTTTSLGRDDLPVARMLMQRAWEWIIEAESAQAQEEQA